MFALENWLVYTTVTGFRHGPPFLIKQGTALGIGYPSLKKVPVVYSVEIEVNWRMIAVDTSVGIAGDCSGVGEWFNNSGKGMPPLFVLI